MTVTTAASMAGSSEPDEGGDSLAVALTVEVLPRDTVPPLDEIVVDPPTVTLALEPIPTRSAMSSSALTRTLESACASTSPVPATFAAPVNATSADEMGMSALNEFGVTVEVADSEMSSPTIDPPSTVTDALAQCVPTESGSPVTSWIRQSRSPVSDASRCGIRRRQRDVAGRRDRARDRDLLGGHVECGGDEVDDARDRDLVPLSAAVDGQRAGRGGESRRLEGRAGEDEAAGPNLDKVASRSGSAPRSKIMSVAVPVLVIGSRPA